MKSKIRNILPLLLLCLLMPVPAESDITIVGGLTHERVATPGESYSGVVFIKNIGDEVREAKVYQTDYLFFCDGRSIYGEPGKLPRSNADWIDFSPKRLAVRPKETVPLNYTVHVVNAEGLKGTYWSTLMVECIPKSSPEVSGSTKPEGNFGIRQVFRYGIQMVTHIGDTGSGKLRFLETKLVKAEEKKTLQVDVENTGERMLRPFLWAELYDQTGSYIGRFEARKLRTYPGTSVRFSVDLSPVPEGTYKALVVADCGGDAVFGATYTLRLGK
jgi:hypothetical protein